MAKREKGISILKRLYEVIENRIRSDGVDLNSAFEVERWLRWEFSDYYEEMKKRDRWQ